MKKLSVKTFFKELGINILLFSVALVFYIVLNSFPAFDDVASQLIDILSKTPAIIVWLVYSVLFRHLVFKKITEENAWLKGLFHLGILVVCTFLMERLVFSQKTYIKTEQGYQLVTDITFIFRFLIFTAYACFYSFVAGFLQQKEKRLLAEKAVADAMVQNLRTQIEPHFIFNTLNNIYALSIEEKAVKTSNSIEELAGLFRYTLKESKAEKVPVIDELEFIEKYIQLHAIRLDQNANIHLNHCITWDKKPAQIAPLLLISFIENAFKFGISMQHASVIDIDAEVKDGTLILKVKNTVHPYSKVIQNGVGLDNTKKRLQLLYAGKYSLEEKRAHDFNEVELKINLS